MKYPLSRWQMFCRETTCFCIGHKWKGAPQRPSQYYDMMDDEVPYAVRKRPGIISSKTFHGGKRSACAAERSCAMTNHGMYGISLFVTEFVVYFGH
jgi:hypothetical protein